MAFFGMDSEEAEIAKKIGNAFRAELGKQFGVTMVQDHLGEHGPAGAVYLTLRTQFREIGNCHITMQVMEIKPGL